MMKQSYLRYYNNCKFVITFDELLLQVFTHTTIFTKDGLIFVRDVPFV